MVEKVGIGDFCMGLMRSFPVMSNEQILQQCRARFPDAQTKISSIYWYRNHIRRNFLVTSAASVRHPTRADLSSSDQASHDWPEWPQPSDDDILLLARITAPYIRFLHPEIVEQIVEDNERRRAAWSEQLAEVGVAPELYLWERSSCTFPGVRRYAGSTEIAAYRKRTVSEGRPADALRLDDNDFPKHVWSFVFLGRPFRKLGPTGYSLAHVVDHKVYKNRGAEEFDREPDVQDVTAASARFGLYSAASNTIFMPSALIRPTDFARPLRNLILRRAAQLYGGFCNLLPPTLGIKEPELEQWALPAFDWHEPVGTTRHLAEFLDFRRRQLDLLFAGCATARGQPM